MRSPTSLRIQIHSSTPALSVWECCLCPALPGCHLQLPVCILYGISYIWVFVVWFHWAKGLLCFHCADGLLCFSLNTVKYIGHSTLPLRGSCFILRRGNCTRKLLFLSERPIGFVSSAVSVCFTRS